MLWNQKLKLLYVAFLIHFALEHILLFQGITKVGTIIAETKFPLFSYAEKRVSEAILSSRKQENVFEWSQKDCCFPAANLVA